MQRINENPGLNILDLGTVNIYTNSYYSYFNYDITNIQTEFNKISNYVKEIENNIINSKTEFHYTRELKTNLNILNFNYEKVQSKIGNLFYRRTKRGLINGLGNIIKSITGNLDSQDAEKYEQMFEKIRKNQKILQNQNLENIALNKEMIEKINKQIENLSHNEIILKSRIIQINSLLKKQMTYEYVLQVKGVIDQITFMLINLLDLINEIETSLTFCNLNKLHSSIINVKELKQIINKTNTNNFWEISIQITSHCKINENQIEYLLEIPMYEQKNQKLLQITPIPTIDQDKIYLLNEEKKLIIKEISKLYYTHDCVNINNGYYCKTNYIEVNECIKQLINNQKNENCKYHKINEVFGLFKIANSNLLYIASSEERNIEIKCSKFESKRKIKGIYKFNIENNCKIDNFVLEQKLTKSKEIIFENFKFEINEKKISNQTFDIRQINKQNIIVPEIKHIDEKKIEDINHNIVNSVLISIIIFIIFCVVLCYLWLNKCKGKIIRKKEIELQDLNE